MKTATITFHASHNYGSVLQAYALQKKVQQLCGNNKIINLRTDRQVDLYTVFTKRKGIKYLFKNASHALYYKQLKRKYDRFESFINNKLELTDKTYRTLEEIENDNLDYDCYIAGSDQIWNPVPADFDWSYYLPFVKSGRKIAYAPSFGQLASTGDEDTIKKISENLKTFDFISVREKGAQKNVEQIIGLKPEIVLDPTLLLSIEEWDRLTPEKSIFDGDYIFLYTLFADKEIISMAKKLSKELKMPVVTSNFSNQYDVFTPFKKRFDAGPLEFLSLIKNARLVLVSSFHGTVFSIIYNTPFFAIKGNEDARISTLLNATDLTERSVDINNISEKAKSAFDIDFNKANKALKEEGKKSIEFLKQALEVEE